MDERGQAVRQFPFLGSWHVDPIISFGVGFASVLPGLM
jgi:hypothetical protein